MTIRPAEPDDTTAMGSVWLRAALVGYEGIFPPEAPMPTVEAVAEDWRRAISQPWGRAAYFVACDAGPDRTVVGTVAAVPDPDETARGHVQALFVDPGHWGRGIGRALHDAALDHLRLAGFRVAVLWVIEGNVRARAMIERWGWRSAPVRQTGYPGVDEVCYLVSL
ncbi:MAG TPA: GNAT family N-acetyltransferase [Acidimicrobiales bacterium]